MLSFQEYLKEEVSETDAMRHIEHIEDSMLNLGSAGIKETINYFNSFINREANVTVKVDGSPSLIFGIDPKTKKFFVATKGLFAKTPKVNYTDEDIERNHGESGVKVVLKYALKYLKPLVKDGILRGDVIFYPGTKKEIGEYITFKPNTITYAIPKNSEEGLKVAAAEFGIVLHTYYTGNSLDNLVIQTNTRGAFDEYKNKSTDVYVADNYLASEKLEGLDYDVLKKYIQDINSFSTRSYNIGNFLDKLVMKPDFTDRLKIYLNWCVRENKKIAPKEMVQELPAWFEDRINTEKDKFKTDKKKSYFENLSKELQDFIRENQDNLEKLFQVQKIMVMAKDFLINNLKDFTGMKTFYDEGGKLVPAKPEGFVIINKDGKVTKLVDRLDFSRMNFNKDKEPT